MRAMVRVWREPEASAWLPAVSKRRKLGAAIPARNKVTSTTATNSSTVDTSFIVDGTSLSQVGWPARIGVLRTSKHICSFPKYPTARLRLIKDAKVTEIRMFREAFVRRSSSWLNTRRPFLPVQRASHGPSSSHVLIAIFGGGVWLLLQCFVPFLS